MSEDSIHFCKSGIRLIHKGCPAHMLEASVTQQWEKSLLLTICKVDSLHVHCCYVEFILARGMIVILCLSWPHSRNACNQLKTWCNPLPFLILWIFLDNIFLITSCTMYASCCVLILIQDRALHTFLPEGVGVLVTFLHTKPFLCQRIVELTLETVPSDLLPH